MYFPDNFNNKLALELAELISCAYEQFYCFEQDKKWNLPENYILIDEIQYNKSNPQIDKIIESSLVKARTKKEKIHIPIGFVAQKGKEVFIIFRGTITVKEWINNFNTKFCNYIVDDYGDVHEGFMNAYNNIAIDLYQSLAQVRKNKVFIAGHSLGGAFATLATPDLINKFNFKIKAIYTFGSPRTGNNKFVDSFNSHFGKISFRIVNTSDLVTAIPFPMPIAGLIGGYFSHVDTPVDFTVQKEDPDKNHAIETYISELKKYKKKNGILSRLFGKIV